MSLTSLLIHDVRVINPTTSDDNGDTILTYAEGATAGVAEKWWIEQVRTGETVGNRTAVASFWFGAAPADSAVTSLSRIVFGDRVLEVEGDPATKPTPSGDHHVEVDLVERRG